MSRAFVLAGFVVACGDPDSPAPEGSPATADTGVIAPPPLPTAETAGDTGQLISDPTGSVTVRLSTPLRDAPAQLMVADREGEHLTTSSTNERELRLDDVPIGGFVTQRIETPSGAVRLVTFGQVQDGDVLHFPGFDDPGEAMLGGYELELTDEPPPDWSFAVIESTCASRAVLEIPYFTSAGLDARCLRGNTVDAFAVASSVTLQPLAIASVIGAPLEGSPPNLSGIVALGDWSTDFGTVSGQYTHAGEPGSVTIRTEALRGSRAAPRGLIKSGPVSDGTVIEIATPVDPLFHDEFQILLELVPDDSPTSRELVLAGRSFPPPGNPGIVALGEDVLPPVPPDWALDQSDRLSLALPLPPEWSCDNDLPDVVEVTAEGGNGSWTFYGPWRGSTTFPNLDPALDLRPKGGFPEVAVAVHATPRTWDDLRQSPVLSQGPQAWLSEASLEGVVCTNRRETWVTSRDATLRRRGDAGRG